MKNNSVEKQIEDLAKDMYYTHIGYFEKDVPYMWGQCSPDYRDAWLHIARLEVEDDIAMEIAFSQEEES
ncbi:hypothetical protein [Vibrio phage S4-7]|nr:hypothetical protein [Vibrio phage S4-7]